MVDFTDNSFIEVPSVSIDTDCNAWFPVLADCLAFALQRGAFTGDHATNEEAVQVAYNWLIENDCEQPP